MNKFLEDAVSDVRSHIKDEDFYHFSITKIYTNINDLLIILYARLRVEFDYNEYMKRFELARVVYPNGTLAGIRLMLK